MSANGIKTCQTCADPGCHNCRGRGYTFELAPPPELLPRVHELKCWPGPFQALVDGRKRFEYRQADRDYQCGDRLLLREWDPDEPAMLSGPRGYTGKSHEVRITYLIFGGQFGVPAGYCVMSIEEET